MRPETQKNLAQSGTSEQDFLAAMRQVFPFGHEDFLPTTIAEMELHSVKNHDYAKGGEALGNFNRVAAILALYPGLDLSDRRIVALTYAMKQLDAVLWGLCKKIAHKVEGINERLGDISIYAKIVMCMNIEDARNRAIDEQFGLDLARVQNERALAAEHEARARKLEACCKTNPVQGERNTRVEVSAQGRTVTESYDKQGPVRHGGSDVAYGGPTKGCPDLNRTR